MDYKRARIAVIFAAAAGLAGAAGGFYAGHQTGYERGFDNARDRAQNPLYGAATAPDGDTLVITNEFGRHNVRIYGIDAPEARQSCGLPDGTRTPCGQTARDRMRALLSRGPVSCEKIEDRDRYGRYVAVCAAADGTDLGGDLIANGYAVEYEGYSDGRYRAAQDAAQTVQRGVWGMDFMPPAQWRTCYTGTIKNRPQNCPATP